MYHGCKTMSKEIGDEDVIDDIIKSKKLERWTTLKMWRIGLAFWMLCWFQNLLNHYSCGHYVTSYHHFGNFGKYAISDCFFIALVVVPMRSRWASNHRNYLAFKARNYSEKFTYNSALIRREGHVIRDRSIWSHKKLSGGCCNAQEIACASPRNMIGCGHMDKGKCTCTVIFSLCRRHV